MATKKFRLTLVVEYSGDSEYYGTEDAGEMAAIDEKVFQDDPAAITYLVDGFKVNEEGVLITVEPIE